MIKQLTILAMTAAFGLAHAADIKPSVAEAKAAITPAAVTVKAEAPKVVEAVKAPEAKPASAPKVKEEVAQPVEKARNAAKKHGKKEAQKAVEAVPAVK